MPVWTVLFLGITMLAGTVYELRARDTHSRLDKLLFRGGAVACFTAGFALAAAISIAVYYNPSDRTLIFPNLNQESIYAISFSVTAVTFLIWVIRVWRLIVHRNRLRHSTGTP